MSCLCVRRPVDRGQRRLDALRHQRSDQLSACKLLHKTFRVVPRRPAICLSVGSSIRASIPWTPWGIPIKTTGLPEIAAC